ncbi:MAG: sterol desaturase family protein [Deltaproteobacteria bacterium]|nr:sterol desaturase family protein [Deltaproteobacteria bacterium]
MWQLAITSGATLVAAVFECRERGFVASWVADPVRRRRNAAYLLSNFAVVALLSGITAWMGRHLAPAFHWSGPVWVDVAGCVLVAEFLNWVFHWAKHRHRWLWTFHLQHHVETRYDISLTLHTHPLEVILSGTLMVGTLRLLGFSGVALEVFSTLYFVSNLYKHGAWRVGLGPLDWILVGPALHRLHHARELDGNFGSVLTVYDVLFGTARWPDAQAWTVQTGTRGGEPFGFIPEFLAFLRTGRSGS